MPVSDGAVAFREAMDRCVHALAAADSVAWARCADSPGFLLAAIGEEFFEFSMLDADGPIATADLSVHALEMRIRNAISLIASGPPEETQPALWPVLRSPGPDDEHYFALRRRMYRDVVDVPDATTCAVGA